MAALETVANRIGQALAGDARCAAVHRLVEAEAAGLRHARAEAGRGQQAQRAGDRGRLVRQDVAEQVLGDDHVVVRRLGQDQVGGRIHQRVLDADRWVPRRDLVHHLAPEPAGGQHVGLVDAGQVPAAAGGKLEGELDDPLDLRARVAQRVDHGLDPVVLLAALGTPEVEAPGQLAQDQDVGAGADLRAQRRGSIERGVRRDRAKVGEQLERRSEAEQGVLRPRRADGSSQRGPPTAPSSTASAPRQASRVACGSASPVASMAAPPTSCSSQLSSNPNRSPAASTQRRATSQTSGPIPSPGR